MTRVCGKCRVGVRAGVIAGWRPRADPELHLLNDPDTVDLRLVQLYEFGMTLTPEGLLDLAGPLTLQAMAGIEEAMNTPFGVRLAQV